MKNPKLLKIPHPTCRFKELTQFQKNSKILNPAIEHYEIRSDKEIS
jgi:hypothetical protein